jgi:hypothetical protein
MSHPISQISRSAEQPDQASTDLTDTGAGNLADVLPFIGRHADGKPNFWSVARSGGWGADCAVGEAYARMFLERVRAHQSRPLLAWIVEDMVRAGPANWSGVEVGFLQYMERASARFMLAGVS